MNRFFRNSRGTPSGRLVAAALGLLLGLALLVPATTGIGDTRAAAATPSVSPFLPAAVGQSCATPNGNALEQCNAPWSPLAENIGGIGAFTRTCDVTWQIDWAAELYIVDPGQPLDTTNTGLTGTATVRVAIGASVVIFHEPWTPAKRAGVTIIGIANCSFPTTDVKGLLVNPAASQYWNALDCFNFSPDHLVRSWHPCDKGGQVTVVHPVSAATGPVRLRFAAQSGQPEAGSHVAAIPQGGDKLGTSPARFGDFWDLRPSRSIAGALQLRLDLNQAQDLCAGIWGGATGQNTNIVIEPCSTAPGQQWIFVPLG